MSESHELIGGCVSRAEAEAAVDAGKWGGACLKFGQGRRFPERSEVAYQ